MSADLERIFRQGAGRLVPYLLRRLGPRHFDLAEDAVQDAFVEALRHWPLRGAPDDPRAWLLKTAHRKALDRLKRAATAERHAHLLDARAGVMAVEPGRDLPDEIAVLLLACHPSLPREAQVALALRTLGGLSTPEVARALLISEAAAAQRIVRAKREMARIDPGPIRDTDLDARIDGALDVLYLVFTEGCHATDGEAGVRAGLVGDALHLASLLAASSATARPRVHALLSLMHFGASRLPARVSDMGALVLLEHQDRSRWDAGHRARGFHHLGFASAGREVSRFHLEAGIAALHAQAAGTSSTDWLRILSLYDEMVARFPSPVVALNRAVAVLQVHGAEAAERALAAARVDPGLAHYAPLHATAATIAAKRGDKEQAVRRMERALHCPASAPLRRFMEEKRREWSRDGG